MKKYKIQEHIVTVKESVWITDYLVGVFDQYLTKSSVRKAVKAGLVAVNGIPAKTVQIVADGMIIDLYETEDNVQKPYPILLEKAFEDDHLAIVNKPAGLPTSGNFYRSLENALAFNFEKNGALQYPKPVHRLDSLASGLLICAKTIEARFKLGQMFEKGLIDKTYQALVMGKTPDFGEIDMPVDGKLAFTGFRVVNTVRSLQNDYLTLLSLSPKTGRTHQLRIHCAESGFPIYGDQLYAGKTIKNKGLFLVCTHLRFIHPVSNEYVNVEIHLPSKFEKRMQTEQRRWDQFMSGKK